MMSIQKINQRKMTQNAGTKEIASLTSLRALAAIMVWFSHYLPRGNPNPLNWICSYGGRGVDFFFALSGFLFTVLYFDKQFQKTDLSAYFIKRITRIYPTYWFVMGCVILLEILTPLFPAPPFSMGDFLLNVFLLQGYITRDRIALANHIGQPIFHEYLVQAWTLTVEELFYACFPLILLFIRSFCLNKTKSSISMTKVSVFLIGIALLDIQLWGQFACFALGIIGGLFVLQYPQSKWINDKRFSSLLGVAGMFIFCFAVFLIGKKTIDWFQFNQLNTVVYAVIFGLSGTLIILSLYGKSWFRKVFENKAIVYGGKISFAFYLIHGHIISLLKLPLLNAIALITSKDVSWLPAMLFAAIIVFLITGLLSALIYEQIEMPVQTYLRSRWLQGKRDKT